MKHHGEAFTEGRFVEGGYEWGWQCFACGWETTGHPEIADAEVAGDQHISETEADG